MPRWTLLKRRIRSPSQCAFTSGCCESAVAVAFRITSLNETLNSSPVAAIARATRPPRERSNSAVEVESWDGANGLSEALRDGLADLRERDVVEFGSGSRRSALGARQRPPFTASSMSRFMMRPPGPLPATGRESSPRSPARRRASGEVRETFAGGGGVRACRWADRVGRRRRAWGSAGARDGAAQAARDRRRAPAPAVPQRRGAGPLRRAGDDRVDVLVRAADDAEQVAHGARLTFAGDDLADHAIAARDDLHHRLVRLHLGEHVALRDLLALLLRPFDEAPLFHRGRERLHHDSWWP